MNSEGFTAREEDLLLRMARDFYGWGGFDRPYWFVGTEPGGASLDELRRKLESWAELECGELVCNRQHHLLAGITSHHKIDPPPQKTWRPLMLAMLAYKGQYQEDNAALRWIKDEQSKRFGCDGGDSAVIELGGLPAPNRNHWPYGIVADPSLRSRHVYVSTCFPERAARIRAAAAENEPEFVWMYGSRRDYMSYWETIAGGAFQRDERLDYDYRVAGRTVFAVTDHTTYLRPNRHWVAFGRSLRERVGSLRGD